MLALLVCAVALAASDVPEDPTSLSAWVEVVAKFGLAPTGFGAIVYWLVRYHIPALQSTFTDGLKTVVEDHKTTRADDRKYHEQQIGAIKESIADEGQRNRDHREAEGKLMRQTLTGLSAKGLRAMRDEDDEPVARRTTG